MVGKDKEATDFIGVRNDTDETIKVRERDMVGGYVPHAWARIKPKETANVKIRPDYAKKAGLTVLTGAKAKELSDELPKDEPETEVKAVVGRVSGKVVETKKATTKKE